MVLNPIFESTIELAELSVALVIIRIRNKET